MIEKTDFDGMLQEINKSSYSAFYSTQCSSSKDTYDDLSILTWDTIVDTPLKNRVYTTEKRLLKLVEHNGKSAIIARTLRDIVLEPVDISGVRPLIAFSAIHEGIMWSLFCYENNILPLIAEISPEITILTATRYKIDTILADNNSFRQLKPLLKKSKLLEHVREIVIIDEVFIDSPLFEDEYKNITVTHCFALPETGIIAINDNPRKTASFSFTNDIFMEYVKEEVVVSRLVKLPTPIIKYHLPRVRTLDGENRTCILNT